MSDGWIKACKTSDIEPEDVIRFDHGDHTFAIYRTSDNKFYATDGLCTHQKVHLSGGFVMDHLIECPKHNGRFDFTNGHAQGAPVCLALKTYPTKVEGDEVFIQLAGKFCDDILYFRSVWGLDDFATIEDKFKKIKSGGFDGVELDVPLDVETCKRARQSLDELGLAVVAQQWRTSGKTVAEHQAGFAQQYERALLLKPLYLNSHTGCDHFTLEENLAIFDYTNGLAAKHGVPVYHETHRGRALFSAPATMQFLDARPELKLVADFSHWCCVHESLLADQAERVEHAAKNTYVIHARVGHAEGPQIPDPRDAFWQPNLEAHLAWWKRIAPHRRAEGCAILPVCPEFGPAPYMTLLPHTRKPIADLWEVNCFMRDWLRKNL
jgi:MocE subfamily Rieske [2Fe-2S] domain protein